MYNQFNEDKKREEIIAQYYNTIMNRRGMDQVKEIVRKWELLRKNIGVFPSDEAVLLPEYLWVSRSGTGKTEMLQLLAGYLDAAQLMPFSGMEKVIEYKLNYCSPEAPFDELDELIRYLSVSSGYRNEFKGILAVNVDNWLHNLNNPHFIDFVEFLAEHNQSLLLILIASPEEEYLEELENILSLYLRIHRVDINMPDVEGMMDFFSEKLDKYHCRLSEDAENLVRETLEIMKDLDGFDGYKTLEFMVQEIVYNFFCSDHITSRIIGTEYLGDYGADGGLISRYRKRWNNKKKIQRGIIGFQPRGMIGQQINRNAWGKS